MFRARRLIFIATIIFIFAITVTGCSLNISLPQQDKGKEYNKDVLMQVSTINALLEGVYDGISPIGTLKKYGDFGIGTFAGLDGEMVELDNNFYQIKADGKVYDPADSILTPFAEVTFFDSDQKEKLQAGMDFKEFEQYLDTALPTINAFYAIKIEGIFSYMKTRSVPVQQKPYPKLAVITESEPIFEFENISGTIVGFRCPSYVDGINVIGYHLHFISSSKEAGGHILDFKIQDAIAAIDYTSQLLLILPGEESDFYHINLQQDKQAELEKIEK